MTTTTSTSDPAPGALVPQETATRIRGGALAAYLLIAFGLLWLLEIPVWLTGGIAPRGVANPLFLPLTLAGMFSPAIAAVIVTLTLQRPAHPGRFLGLVPLRPVRRTLTYCAIGFVGPWLLGAAAIGIGALTGVVHLHWTAATAGLLATIPVTSFLTAFAAFGEELGWRGFLLPALRPLGTWPALVLHGIIWGLWHAPVILIGYNYGTTNPVGVLLMTVTTVLMGLLFGWLRMRSGSVYPSSFAHGALNGSSGLLLAALLATGSDDIAASPLGWCGWIVMALVVLGLAVAGTYRWAPQAAPRVRSAAPAAQADR